MPARLFLHGWRRRTAGIATLGERRAGLLVAACWVIVFSGCGTSVPEAQPVTRPEKPNILLVSIDTLSSDRIDLHGASRPTLASLSRLAGRGAWFPNSLSQAPSTPPSHASMFTGRLPFEHGVFNTHFRLADEEVTLAEVLRSAGWSTTSLVSSIRFYARSGFDQGFERVVRIYETEEKNRRSAAIAAEVARIAGLEETRPWFIFAHLLDPHSPYAPPESYRGRWAGPPPPGAPPLEETTAFLEKNSERVADLGPEMVAWLRDAYEDGLGFADDQLVGLLDSVENAANGRPVLVVVTSDHGEEFGEHGYLGHSTYLHEEIIRVPLVIVLEGTIAPGTVVPAVAQNADLFPTVLELAGIETPPTARFARSHAPALRGTASEHRDLDGFRDVVVVQQNTRNWAILATLRDDRRYKLVQQRGGAYELYDRRADPRSDRNIAGDHPEVVQRLLDLALEMGIREKGRSPVEHLSADIVEQLKSLGYTE